MKNRRLSRSINAILVVFLLVAAGGFNPAKPVLAQSGMGVTISEVRIDQPGTDNDEYFELHGPADTSLDGLTYLVLGDGTGGSGVIEAVVDLIGQSIPASGYFVAAESTFTLGAVDLVANLNFENDDNMTHLLVYGFTGANGDDLDTDDDGTLDLTPWEAELDRIALVKQENPPTGTEYHYGPPSVGPDGSYVPGHAFVCDAAWVIGSFDLGVDDTPGAENMCEAPPPPLPDVLISEVRIDQTGDDNDEYFELYGPADTSLDGLTYLVLGDGTGGSGVIEAVADLGGQAIPASGYFVAAESTFTLGTANLTADLNFENSDNVTHLLVYGFTGANGDDLDADDDGVLDVMPWEAELDRIALVEEENPPAGTEYHYGPPSVGPDGSYVPGHAFVCDAAWVVGLFEAGLDDTPGAANQCETPPPPLPDVIINELDSDTPSTDILEFVELYDGGTGNTALDGLVVVFYNGSSDTSYAAYDLDGYTTDAGGYFLLGNAGVTAAPGIVFASNGLQNGADAVAVHAGDAADFPSGTAVTTGNLIDAVVYDTDDADDTGLLVLLNEGQPQVNEAGGGDKDNHSIQRCPNGAGGARNTETYLQAFATPGAANLCETPPPVEQCGDPYTPIYTVQGSGAASPLAGTEVAIQGVVTADFQGSDQLKGFFVQDPVGDGNPATSDGVYVYGNNVDVSVGDYVRVRGQVVEYYDLTEITNTSQVLICEPAIAPEAVVVSLPIASLDLWETYEGMYIKVDQQLFVTGNYTLGRYGEVDLSIDGPLFTPTQVELPGAPALALQDLNDRSRVLLDDASTIQNPEPLPPYLGPNGTLRPGDTIPGLEGVLYYGFDFYRILPTEEVNFTSVNMRPEAPEEVGGSLKAASFNVLNYFNGDGMGGGFPTSRGADTLEEFTRQREKIIAAISALDADVIGLMEIENDGYGEYSAIQDLVNGLNEVAGAGTYAFVDPGLSQIGTDEIAVGLLYQPARVTLVGTTAILDSSIDPEFLDDKNRPPLIQTFEQVDSGERFAVAVNHLKSKGSDCNDVGDPDIGDGQGNCNLTRKAAAEALTRYLATYPTGVADPDFLILGDLNSYGMEDPIMAIKDAGYTSLIDTYIGTYAHSYQFYGQSGVLDQALASDHLAGQVTGTTIWHINADEPEAMNYNDYNQDALYAPDPYRSSDHDPVLIGLDLRPMLEDFVVLAKERVLILPRATVLSGDVGVNGLGDATLSPKAKILNPASRLMADKVRLLNASQAYDVFYNNLLNKGNILGTAYTPLQLPLVEAFPPVPEPVHGGSAVNVPRNGTLALEAGSYGNLRVNRGATLVLTGGVYNFQSIQMLEDAQILIEAPVEIRILTRLHTGKEVKIMPAESAAGLTAGDLRIIIGGMDEKQGRTTSRAVIIGKQNELRANLYAPQGSLAIGSQTRATGAFLAQVVMVGDRVELSLESGW